VIRALADAQLSLPDVYICAVEPSIDGAYQGTSAWLAAKSNLPTAIFADNDIIAFGAMKAIKEHGLKIPDDISIIGFDDLPYCEIIEPPLTTIKVFKHSLGRLAVDRLLDRMKNQVSEVVRIEVATALVTRQSVKTISE
jgi:LacI family transcriptional regulator